MSSKKANSSQTQTNPKRRRRKPGNQNMNDSSNKQNTDDEVETAPLRGGSDTPSNITVSSPNRRNARKNEKIKVFGFDVTPYLQTQATLVFIVFAMCHIVFSIIFASLQEVVNNIDGFKFPQFMTIIQTATYTLCAFLEMKSMSGELGYVSAPKSPVYKYGILSFLTFGGMYCTNSGLKYVSYPTRIIFKAGKPLPTMAIEMLAGRMFTLLDISNVLILTSGITLFCFGEARDLPSFNGYGIVFMSFGVLLDAMTSNYEKKYIFSDGASHAEAMFFASLMGTVWTFITLVATDSSVLWQATTFCLTNPTALGWLVLSSIGGYMSVVFIMLLIKCFNATYTECVKGVRKVLSIAFSYLFISDGNKTFNSFHGWGMGLFIASTFLSVYIKTDIKHLSLKASQYLSRSQLFSSYFQRPRSAN